jgi:hypothetical protein
MYDPQSGKLLALNGKTLGPLGTVATFRDNLPKIFHRMVEFVLHDGRPYFLYEDRKSGLRFGYWKDEQWIEYSVPEGTMDGLARRPVIHTPDGKSFRVFGITDWRPDDPTRCGGDITMWDSSDGGKTWTEGKMIARREDFGHGFQELNKVLNYSGTGVFFIASEPTGPWPEGWRKTVYTHYDNPSRRDKKLYAFDIRGNTIPHATAPGP